MHVSTREFERQPQFDPIRVEGGLGVSLFGLTIARIRLNLDITSLGRLGLAIRSIVADDAEHDDTLTSMTRAELYELARAAEIGGRSRMSRADLISALGSSTP